MDSHTLRRTFLSFFEQKGHTVVPSSSLIPQDPTLLLTVAGMVQFKPYLLGEEDPPYLRAASIQKSFRAEDIDIVGTTPHHLTFFEMMGNFSFGDYFKEKAIPYAYEFVTEKLELDPEVLWFTVYEDDDEAATIWVDDVGVPVDRVQRGGRDNFWQMGVPGPCGPSSEIFVDRGPARGDAGGPIGGAEARYIEIWNLVFMQNVQDEPYHVVGDLPAKNIDTGSGLERVAMILQDVDNAFETDVLRPVLAAAESTTGVRYGTDAAADVSLRVLADHGRAFTFLIGDGVVPSNEGRGYVVRRVLRRAVRHAWALGAEELIAPRLVEAVVDVMTDSYPDLRAKADQITATAVREEERFRRTLESGHGLLAEALDAVGEDGVVPGDTAFKLHDTYGFPIELTAELAAEKGVDVDRERFDALMDEQRQRARAAWRGGAADVRGDLYRSLHDDIGPTEFVGYVRDAAPGRLLAIVRGGEQVERAEQGQDVEVFLDVTPFYAEAGGQVGDTGRITTDTGTLRVSDTQQGVPGLHGHRATVTSGYVQVGQDAEVAIDSARRERIRKSHTGTHILHWALRDAVGDHVHQAGSLVEAGRLRFDFSHHAALAPEEILEVERETNVRVIENAAVETIETTKREAEEMGALAFFGDKYGERVRVVKAGDYSVEFCGGTHVHSTGQVGPLILTAESSIGANLRRVEALTGSAAYERIVQMRAEMERTSRALKAPMDGVGDAVAALLTRARDQEGRLAAYENRERERQAEEAVAGAEVVDGVALVVSRVHDYTADDLRALAISIRARLERVTDEAVSIVGTTREGKGSLVVALTPGLVAKGVAAGAIAGVAAKRLGGGGSRDPELAQAGGPKGGEIGEALEEAADMVRRTLRAL